MTVDEYIDSVVVAAPEDAGDADSREPGVRSGETMTAEDAIATLARALADSGLPISRHGHVLEGVRYQFGARERTSPHAPIFRHAERRGGIRDVSADATDGGIFRYRVTYRDGSDQVYGIYA